MYFQHRVIDDGVCAVRIDIAPEIFDTTGPPLGIFAFLRFALEHAAVERAHYEGYEEAELNCGCEDCMIDDDWLDVEGSEDE